MIHEKTPSHLQQEPLGHGDHYGPLPEDPLDSILEGVNPAAVDEDSLEDLIDQHPLASESMAQIRAIRSHSNLSPEKEKELIQNARSMRAHLGHVIKNRLGIETEEPAEKAAREEEDRIAAVRKIAAEAKPDDTDETLLKRYGLLDDEGRMTAASVRSPLFHGQTKSAFNTYLRFAANFDAMEEAGRISGIRIKNAPQASNLRGEAHNKVAELVQADLELDDFDAARRIVAKMRETMIPNSGEVSRYGSLIRGDKFLSRYANDGAAMTQDQLKSVLDQDNS